VLTRLANAPPGQGASIAVNIAKMQQPRFRANAVIPIARSRASRNGVDVNLRLMLFGGAVVLAPRQS
jgi:hypothetical protein